MTSREYKYHKRKKEEKEDEFKYHWMCRCGQYIESEFHCSFCGNEPPWGCDCSFCNDPYEDGDGDNYDYIVDDIYEQL